MNEDREGIGMSESMTIAEVSAIEAVESAVIEPTQLLPAIEATYSLVAVNATEMATARQGIQDFLQVKISSLEAERQEISDALDEAARHKWRTTTYRSVLRRLDNRILYYGKVLAACEAGFTIVPNMEMDVIAIRREDKDDVGYAFDSGESKHSFRGASPTIDAVEERRLSIGEGEYVSPEPKVKTNQWTTTNDKNERIYKVEHWTRGFQDIDFPLAIANPIVMSATNAAMRKKIFDRIGVVPAQGRKMRGDPIVLGQITLKESAHSIRRASFLIAWYLDPRTL